MNKYNCTIPQKAVRSLNEIRNLIGDHPSSKIAWRLLSNMTVALDFPDESESIALGGDFNAQCVQVVGPLAVTKPEDAKARIIVTSGGIRISDGGKHVEFVKLGDQIDLVDAAKLQIDPVAGYGDVSFVCVCEGLAPEFALINDHANEKFVEAPYYWGYDKRYAHTYEAGGLTWETTDANYIVKELVPNLISDSENEEIIDLGCGEGRDSLWLANQGFHVTGVDVSSSALNRARALANVQGLTPVFLERDVITLRGIEAGSYSVALNMGCLHMLDTDDDRRGHLSRVFEILKPGGTLVINHCQEDWLRGFWSVEDFDSVRDAAPGDVIPRRIRTKDGGVRTVDMEVLRHKVMKAGDLKVELSSVGFTNIRVLEENRFTFGNSAILVCTRA